MGCGIGGPYRNIARFTNWDITGVRNEIPSQPDPQQPPTPKVTLRSTTHSARLQSQVTLNEYQVNRANHLCKQLGLNKVCRSVQGDFMALSKLFPANSFDGAYAIEATCHAPERRGVYGEIFKVLKPGAVFATYEWCLTDAYDKSNATHRCACCLATLRLLSCNAPL